MNEKSTSLKNGDYIQIMQSNNLINTENKEIVNIQSYYEQTP